MKGEPMGDCMNFPDTVEEFMEQYKMTDAKQVYSNGIEYVPIFRMKQWFEQEKDQPTIQPETTYEQVEEYCKKRCLHVVTDDFFHTAQPERKKGEWIEISSINHTYKCSECGRLLVNVADGKNNVSKHYPYCHCGADMRGERQK